MALADLLGVEFITTKKWTDEYRMSHPEWFSMFLIPSGRTVEHYAPELVAEILRKVRERVPPAPEGWMTN